MLGMSITYRTQPSTQTEYLTPAEVADRLKVSLGTVRNMLAAGEIKALRFRRRVRIPASEMVRFEREQTR